MMYVSQSFSQLVNQSLICDVMTRDVRHACVNLCSICTLCILLLVYVTWLQSYLQPTCENIICLIMWQLIVFVSFDTVYFYSVSYIYNFGSNIYSVNSKNTPTSSISCQRLTYQHTHKIFIFKFKLFYMFCTYTQMASDPLL